MVAFNKKNQRGASLIIVIAIILIMGITAAVFVSLINTESFIAMNQSAGLQATGIAEAGREKALYQFKTGTACGSLSYTNSLGVGSFTTTGTLYNPASTTLSAGISSTDTTIPVASVTSYAPHGRIRIESEEINYTGQSTTSCGAFSPPCFTGAQRGVAGTTAGGHLSGLSVSQNQCLIKSTSTVTGPLNNTQRVTELGSPTVSSDIPAPSAPFLDGASSAIGTAETNIGSLATTLPAGNNLIIVVVSLQDITGINNRPLCAGGTNDFSEICAGNLMLKKGATVLASNENLIRVGNSTTPGNNDFPQETQFLLYKDTAAAASPTYDVTALAPAAGISSEVKMIVINSAPNSSFQDGGNQTIGTMETTVLTHAPTLVAGDNVIIAAIQLNNTAGATRTINAGNLRLRKGATVLASNQFDINLERQNRANRGTGVLLMARDAGATANPTYTITGLASNNGINGEAKIIVLNGMPSAFLDTGSVAIGTTETVIGSLGTSFKAGENVVIAATQYDNSAASQRNIVAGSERVVVSGATQSSNEFDINLCRSATTVCDDFASGLLWHQATAAPSPTYDVRALASGTGINAETKIMAIHIDVPNIDSQEVY